MAVTLNASTSSGLVQTADTSGVITLQNNGTDALSVSSGNLQFNSGYGSLATAYGCRAWVNFDGTGTVAIRASGNVSSITDNGVGQYQVNFTNAMPDTNYSCNATGNRSDYPTDGANFQTWAYTFATGSVKIRNGTPTSGTAGDQDASIVSVAIFR